MPKLIAYGRHTLGRVCHGLRGHDMDLLTDRHRGRNAVTGKQGFAGTKDRSQ